MLKIFATWSRVTSLVLRTRCPKFATATHSRITIIFNRVYTTNSNDLSLLSEKKDASGSSKRKRDNSTELVRWLLNSFCLLLLILFLKHCSSIYYTTFLKTLVLLQRNNHRTLILKNQRLLLKLLPQVQSLVQGQVFISHSTVIIFKIFIWKNDTCHHFF